MSPQADEMSATEDSSPAVPDDPPSSSTSDETVGGQASAAPRPPRKIRTIHLLLPYIIGLVWILLHPIVSVVTGELKCRGSYIDENGLEPGNLRVLPYPTDRRLLPAINVGSSSSSQRGRGRGDGGLCDAINTATVTRSPFVSKRGVSPTMEEQIDLGTFVNIVCHSHASFDLVKIIPASSPAEPAEAIGLVVDSPSVGSSWGTSDVHLHILALVGRLADPKSTPWLAKTILIVSPHRHESDGSGSLDATIQTVLDAYLGSRSDTTSSIHRPLPPSFTSFMIRQVIVIDAAEDSSSNDKPQLRILPQGRRGVLPNLDFVFALTKIFGAATLWRDANVRMHPHHEWLAQLEKWAGEKLSTPSSRQYGADLLGMIGFATSLVVGPYPPHSPVLDRGIDAVTIQATLPSRTSAQRPSPLAAELVQKLEHSIRALSNLHERLHHSVTQYLLPSSTKFVSNGEYTYPTVLILLPLAVRAASLVLVDLERFSFGLAFRISAICVGIAAFIWGFTGLGFMNDLSVINTVLAGAYMLALWGIGRLMSDAAATKNEDTRDNTKRDRRSIQFLACLFAVYVHVPIALAHVSLAVISALLCTPVLAFPTYAGGNRGILQRLLSCIFLFATWPPVLLVPNVFPEYTTYVATVYTPLHLFAASLWLF